MEDAKAGESRRRADAAVTQGSVFTACSSLTVMIMFWLSVTAATVFSYAGRGLRLLPCSAERVSKNFAQPEKGGGRRTELRS